MTLRLVKYDRSNNWYIRGSVGGKSVFRTAKTDRQEIAQALLNKIEDDMLEDYLRQNGVRRQKTSRRDAPPSVKHHLYRHYNAANELLYVGISYNSIFRLHQHSKSARWFDEVAIVKITHYDTREDAIRAELRAIKLHNPKYNIRHAGVK